MQVDFQILGSSSSGNAALLRTGTTRILIDAGFSGKRLAEMLKAHGESPDSLDAVFLTHEHHDHAQGLRGLSRRADLPVFANRDTADAIQGRLRRRVNWQVFETGREFRFRDLQVRSFSLPHDAYDPVGFTFHWGEEGDLFRPPGSLAWVTDLGYVPEHVRSHIQAVETLVIEANYDDALLDRDEKRPWATKQRIRGRHGHLSNAHVFDLLSEIAPTSLLRRIYLAHLSKDCNDVKLVRAKFAPIFQENGRIALHVVDPAVGTPPAVKMTA